MTSRAHGQVRVRKDVAQADLEPGFREMAETFKTYLSREEYLAAYVVGFSFLEDRIGAMYAVCCESRALESSRWTPLGKMVDCLRKAGDLTPELAKKFREESRRRNKLVHQAMWNLRAVRASAAESVEKLARDADRARSKQKRRLERQASRA